MSTVPVPQIDNSKKISKITKDFLKTIVKCLSDDRMPRTLIFKVISNILKFYDNYLLTVLQQIENINLKDSVRTSLEILKSIISPDSVEVNFCVGNNLVH